jgi:hypothetical protein
MDEALRVRFRFFMYLVWVLPLSVLLSASLMGCGAGNQLANQRATKGSPWIFTLGPADSWQFLLTPAPSEAPWASDIEVVVNSVSDKFAGTAHMIVGADQNNVSCYVITDPIPLTGTIDAQGNLSGTSAALRGQVLSFTGVLAADRSSISQGAYTFKGGCADGHRGTLTGLKFKPIDGTYNGTLAETGDSEALSADLKQTSSSDGNGFLDVTGTVTYTGACNEKFTVTSSDLAGRFIQLQLGAADGSNTTIYGNVDPDGSKLWLVDYEGGCNGFNGVGLLSLQ